MRGQREMEAERREEDTHREAKKIRKTRLI